MDIWKDIFLLRNNISSFGAECGGQQLLNYRLIFHTWAAYGRSLMHEFVCRLLKYRSGRTVNSLSYVGRFKQV